MFGVYPIEPLLLALFTSMAVVVLFTQTLIKVSRLKNLVDEPDDERKLHKLSVPSLGGIMIFAACVFSFFLWYPLDFISEKEFYASMKHIKYIVACLLILFFVGVKDDIIGTSPEKKLLAHFMVAFILVLMADIRISGMKGIFGLYELPYAASVFLSAFAYIVIVNAFNLIDGIDGLAAGVGSIASLAFGTWFFLAEDYVMAVLAFSLLGALLGFLVFNFSPAKIFMGDSGSLTIGLIISVMSINLIEYDASLLPESMLHISKPVFVLSCLAYPLIDTLRVFCLRILKGRSPFSADRNHIHHRLLDIGLDHKMTSIFIYFYSLIVIFLSLTIDTGSASLNFISMLSLSFLMLQVPYMIKKKRVSIDAQGKFKVSKPIDVIKKSKDIISN